MSTAIYSIEDDEIDAEAMLREMGLSSGVLNEVCRRGLGQYLTATPHHAASAPGTFLYHELVRSLRDLLLPTGWEPAEEGLELAINEELSLAIAVSSGDAYVGIPTRVPSFRYERGPVTRAAIDGNASQLGLFDDVPGFAAFATLSRPKRVDFDKVRTWWLLHYVDDRRGTMRAELSLPFKAGAGVETAQWETRIILNPIPFDEEPDVARAGDDPDGSDLDVPVRKKA